MNLPNKITVARLVLVPFFIGAYIADFNLIALVIFIVAAATDFVDGKLARKRNIVTNFGKIMDPLADKILVYSAFCLMIPEYVPAWMFIIILAREFLIAGIRTVAASEGIVIAAQMSGKIKTVLQMILVPVFIILPVFEKMNGSPLYMVFYILGQVLLWGALIMTVYSGIEYAVNNSDVFKEQGTK